MAHELTMMHKRILRQGLCKYIASCSFVKTGSIITNETGGIIHWCFQLEISFQGALQNQGHLNCCQLLQYTWGSVLMNLNVDCSSSSNSSIIGTTTHSSMDMVTWPVSFVNETTNNCSLDAQTVEQAAYKMIQPLLVLAVLGLVGGHSLFQFPEKSTLQKQSNPCLQLSLNLSLWSSVHLRYLTR